jgi:uncharacterized protein (DUF1697 family)
VFQSPAREVKAMLRKVVANCGSLLGEEPEILLRTVREIERLVEELPFAERQVPSAAKLYLAFLSREPPRRPALPLVASQEALEVVAVTDREAFIIFRPQKNGFFDFPNNFLERALGVSATTRNWSTVTKLLELACSK